MKRRSAFTLVETMIAAVIFSFIIAGTYGAFMVGNRAWIYYNEHTALKQETRRGMIFMMNELREAKNILIVKEEGRLRINFYRPGVGNVSFLWAGDGDQAGRILRVEQDKTRILAKQITALSFKQFPDAILIDIKSTKVFPGGKEPVSVRLRAKVALRAKTGIMKAPG
ncbi:MAG: prepilin-type N-terminal cleavage/methylation domain-containing protein [Candidatus Omnitrophota bacterium]|nr:prepilin-type N-terminal cleavage/methylation domain-containing protein [Candidatus Omnitrophota bacterium]MDZ4243203.1 prepilin-type N-terminal cleavage/methylation domain-containing protein [Candidatus Omnitrophota bacterium]